MQNILVTKIIGGVHVCTTLKEENFAEETFTILAIFGKIRESLFPRNIYYL